MAGAIRDRRLLLGLSLFILGAVLFATLADRSGQHDVEAAGGGPAIGLSLASFGFCDPPDSTDCLVQLGSQFVVSVDAIAAPPQGYVLAQAWISYGDELGNTKANGAVKDVDAVWPDCDPITYLQLNTDDNSNSVQDSYQVGCLTALIAPTPSSYEGSLFTFTLTCTQTPSDHVIELIAFDDPPANTYGALYMDEDETLYVPKVSSLTIHCDFGTDTPPPPSDGPDLVVKEMKIELETGADCNFPSTNLGVSIRFSNSGNEPAGPFTVEVNGVQQQVPGGLGAGLDQTFWFKGYEQFNDNVGIVDVLGDVAESDESNNTLSTFLPVPTLPPTCTPPPTATPKPPDGDTDGDSIPNSIDPDDDNDGCTDVQELGPDPTMGGTRDPHDRWDYYDVIGFNGAPPDQVIDLANDILGVILHYSPNGYTPNTPALVGSGVYDDFDRGPQDPADGWPTAPDGVIDLANDILGVILQYQNNCA